MLMLLLLACATAGLSTAALSPDELRLQQLLRSSAETTRSESGHGSKTWEESLRRVQRSSGSEPVLSPTASRRLALQSAELMRLAEGLRKRTASFEPMRHANAAPPGAGAGDACGLRAFVEGRGATLGATRVSGGGGTGRRRGIYASAPNATGMFFPEALIVDLPTVQRLYRREFAAEFDASGSGKLEELLSAGFSRPTVSAAGREKLSFMPRDAAELQELRSGLLALFVLDQALTPSSEWAPYACSLPDVAPQPLFWAERQRAKSCKLWARKGAFRSVEQCQIALELQRVAFVSMYLRVLVPLQRLHGGRFGAKAGYTLEAYLWALGIVASRSFSWAEGYALVPYIDMMNGERPGDCAACANTGWRSNVQAVRLDWEHGSGSVRAGSGEDGGLYIEPSREVEEGAELTIDYGSFHSYALQYGFLSPAGASGRAVRGINSIGPVMLQ